MEAKFKIMFETGEFLSAGSLEHLIEAIQNEDTKWREIFPPRTFVDEHGRELEVNYTSLIRAVGQYDFTKGAFYLNSHDSFKIFPAYDGEYGKLILDLNAANHLELAKSVILFWRKNISRQVSQRRKQVDPDVANLVGQVVGWSRRDTLDQIDGSAAKGRISSAIEHIEAMKEEHDGLAGEYSNAANASLREVKDTVRVFKERSYRLERVGRYLSKRAFKRQAAQEAQWSEKWQHLHDSYMQQLQYRKSVELWQKKGAEHRAASFKAFIAFCIAAFLTAIFVLTIVACFGDYIASTFTKYQIDASGVQKEVFSYKGPVTIAGLLLVASIFIWIMRFSSKIYLSERHLALASEERKAFAETYLALVADQQISREQEAIVLGALFRSGQDGIIRDDDGGLDISAASILARALAGQK